MTLWTPASIEVAPAIVTPFCAWGTEGFLAGASTPASATWPAANTAYFYPVSIPVQTVVQRWMFVNGATAASAWAVGIYRPDGTRVSSSGAVTQAGVNVPQFSTVNLPITLAAGLYYVGASAALTTLTVIRHTLTGVDHCRIMGMLATASAHPLSADVTFATIAANIVPYAGFSTVTGP